MAQGEVDFRCRLRCRPLCRRGRQSGANVVACDLSGAIDACRRTTIDHEERVTCIHASIYNLPLRAGVCDAVYCFGVIQHTPDPARTITTHPRFLKDGGSLARNFYERDWRARG